MRVVVIYRSESDYARQVSDFLRDFSRQTGHVLEEMSPDSAEGNNFCEVYDIVGVSNNYRAERQWSIAKPLAWLAATDN